MAGISSRHFFSLYMSKVFCISDTWFNRSMGNETGDTIETTNRKIIDTWNKFISKEDAVYVLGGFGIGELYSIVLKLNGEIHFLDNCFNDDERRFMDDLEYSLLTFGSPNHIVFETGQMFVLSDLDCVLSYFPLSDWPGKSTGTFCIHGMNGMVDIDGKNISCCAYKNGYVPVDIDDTRKSVEKILNIFN